LSLHFLFHSRCRPVDVYRPERDSILVFSSVSPIPTLTRNTHTETFSPSRQFIGLRRKTGRPVSRGVRYQTSSRQFRRRSDGVRVWWPTVCASAVRPATMRHMFPFFRVSFSTNSSSDSVGGGGVLFLFSNRVLKPVV